MELLSDGTLMVSTDRRTLDSTKRIILGCPLWCKTFYEDAQPQWIPVTPDTMPEKGRVVVVCGEKGTWDFGTYRGHCSSIHLWIWKKNTLKTVYWWMYKDDALPPQPKGE